MGGGGNVITRVLVRRRQEGQSQRRGCDNRSRVREKWEDVTLLILKMEEGATS